MPQPGFATRRPFLHFVLDGQQRQKPVLDAAHVGVGRLMVENLLVGDPDHEAVGLVWPGGDVACQGRPDVITHAHLGVGLVVPDDSLGVRTMYNYIWLDNIPVAQFREQYQSDGTHIGSQLVYIHADHLYTPRLATGKSEISPGFYDDDALVWDTFAYEYGQTFEITDPD